MPKDVGYKTHHNSGGKKDRMPKQTRVTNAREGQTPVAGAPQHKDLHHVAKRVTKGPGFPRKNDPKMMKQASMGLKIGSRVTSSRARTR